VWQGEFGQGFPVELAIVINSMTQTQLRKLFARSG
jgi:hypothetical protein